MSALAEIVLFGVIAGIVLMQLYRTLGRTDGDEERHRMSAKDAAEGYVLDGRNSDRDRSAQRSDSLGGEGEFADVELFPGHNRLREADPTFDPVEFMAGAQAAYVQIVQAFHAGDKETLRAMVTEDVMSSWEPAMAQASGDSQAPEEKPIVVHIKIADIAGAGVMGQQASVKVDFDATIGDGPDAKETLETWTFVRHVRDSDPNWLLSSVDPREA